MVGFRHCEERQRRGNPAKTYCAEDSARWILTAFGLRMTGSTGCVAAMDSRPRGNDNGEANA